MWETIWPFVFFGSLMGIMVGLCALMGWAIDSYIKEIQDRGKG